MKTTLCLLSFLLCFRAAAAIVGISFDSTTGEELFRDSSGAPLLTGDPLTSSFSFQLGTFDSDFLPDANNTTLWFDHWIPFDTLTYSQITVASVTFDLLGKPAGDMPPDEMGITSAGLTINPVNGVNETFNFSGKTAYLFVHNGTNIEDSGTEWFLASVSAGADPDNPWTFPIFDENGNCTNCATENIQWSMSQLRDGSVTPIWGGQSVLRGDGSFSVTDDTFTLQTYVIPEPAGWILAGVALASALLFSKRKGERS